MKDQKTVPFSGHTRKAIEQAEALKGLWGVRGLRALTLLDYPGKVAAIVFFGGCNFRCPFCHNPHLVLPDLIPALDRLNPEEVMGEIARRRKLVNAVVFSGGEPLLQERLLAEMLALAKELGLATKVDTNGSRPDALSRLLDKGLVDAVAMDIKTTPRKYPQATGGGNFGPVMESLRVLREKAPCYILRTTLVPGLVTLEDMEEIGELARGASEYHLQPFSNKITLDPSFQGVYPYPPKEMEEMARVLERKGLKVLRLW